jgi:hypothetical protein
MKSGFSKDKISLGPYDIKRLYQVWIGKNYFCCNGKIYIG